MAGPLGGSRRHHNSQTTLASTRWVFSLIFIPSRITPSDRNEDRSGPVRFTGDDSAGAPFHGQPRLPPEQTPPMAMLAAQALTWRTKPVDWPPTPSLERSGKPGARVNGPKLSQLFCDLVARCRRIADKGRFQSGANERAAHWWACGGKYHLGAGSLELVDERHKRVCGRAVD